MGEVIPLRPDIPSGRREAPKGKKKGVCDHPRLEPLDGLQIELACAGRFPAGLRIQVRCPECGRLVALPVDWE